MTDITLPSLGAIDRPGPAQDMWAVAAVRESYRPEALLTSWLESHLEASREARRAAMRTALDLQSAGTPSTNLLGEAARRLPSRRRLEVLQMVGLERARRALSAASPQSRTLAERTLAALLAGERVPVNRQDRVQLMALSMVAPWAAAAGVPLPFEPREIERNLGQLDFLRIIGGPDLYRFVGRDDLRRSLQAQWDKRRPRFSRTVLVEGPGGIGKSLAISRFIADLLESRDPENRPAAVFHLDFDRPSLQQARTSTIFLEFVRQAARWWCPNRQEELSSLARDLSAGGADLEFGGRVSRSIEAASRYPWLAHMLIDALGLEANRGIIIFVDSFEQVETFDDIAARSAARACESIEHTGVPVLSIYASRAFRRPKFIRPSKLIRLSQFRVHEAEAYLLNEASRKGIAVTPPIAREVRKSVGRSPLALRLAVELLEKEAETFDPRQWGDLARKSPERVQATLYDRILHRIRNRELRKIAIPGLLVRRLTPEVIAEVLAGPCLLDLSKSSPKGLMEGALREGQLFISDPSDPGALRHRQDVRSLMLADLETVIPEEVAGEINRRAVAFYAERGGFHDRVEELYHRLRLNQSVEQLDARWIPEAGLALKPALREFPVEARSYVRAQLGAASVQDSERPSPTHQAARSPREWQEMRLFAQKEMQSGGVSPDFLDWLAREKLDRLDGPLADIYADFLVRQGRHDQLLDEARALLTNQRGLFPGEAAVGVFSLAAAVLEGRQLLSEAQTFWLQALRLATSLEDEALRLASLIGSIRIRRKLAAGSQARKQELDQALALLTGRIQAISKQRVLARETAAELAEVLLDEEQGEGRQAVRRLISFVLEANEAFPSAGDNPLRLEEVAKTLFGGPGPSSVSVLHDLTAKLLYSSQPDDLRRLVGVLREEVDWSLARAALPESR
ncbi:MAG: ATP-binding protein [Alphaproteobacteria bacterium]|nr:ATP-binding protein [Alphaproteobacteria bacterium]